MFGFLLVTYLMGAFNDAATSFQDGNMNQALINVMGFCIVVSVATLHAQPVNTNQKGFIDMIRELNGMHEYDHEESVDILRKNCLKMFKIYRFFMIIVGSVAILLHLIGVKAF
jgi:hypothetical protein